MKTEPTEQGEQVLIEGVEPVTKRPTRKLPAQLPADSGLFDTGARAQTDLVELTREGVKE